MVEYARVAVDIVHGGLGGRPRSWFADGIARLERARRDLRAVSGIPPEYMRQFNAAVSKLITALRKAGGLTIDGSVVDPPSPAAPPPTSDAPGDASTPPTSAPRTSTPNWFIPRASAAGAEQEARTDAAPRTAEPAGGPGMSTRLDWTDPETTRQLFDAMRAWDSVGPLLADLPLDGDTRDSVNLLSWLGILQEAGVTGRWTDRQEQVLADLRQVVERGPESGARNDRGARLLRSALAFGRASRCGLLDLSPQPADWPAVAEVRVAVEELESALNDLSALAGDIAGTGFDVSRPTMDAPGRLLAARLLLLLGERPSDAPESVDERERRQLGLLARAREHIDAVPRGLFADTDKMRAGVDSAQALRLAQLDMLDPPRRLRGLHPRVADKLAAIDPARLAHPASWAGFVYHGS